MGRHLCCNQQKVKRGLWSPEEDEKLVNYIMNYGHGCWSEVPEKSGLQRCGKSCRLRWINYLRPDIRRGNFTPHEEKLIIHLHRMVGNRWAYIASHLPGRTDNEIKNYWNSWIKKKLAKDEARSTTEASKRKLLQFLPLQSAIGNEKENPLFTAGITFTQSNSTAPQIDHTLVKGSLSSLGLVNPPLWNYNNNSNSNIYAYNINEGTKNAKSIHDLEQNIDSDAREAKDDVNTLCESSSGYARSILVTSNETPELQFKQSLQNLASYENAFHSYSLDSIAGDFYFDPNSKASNGINTNSLSGGEFLSCTDMAPVYTQHEMLDFAATTLWESGSSSNIVGSLKCSHNEGIGKCSSYLPKAYADSEESAAVNVITDQNNIVMERGSSHEEITRTGDKGCCLQSFFGSGEQDSNIITTLECYGSQALLQDISQQLFD